ncbi:zinc finger protein-like 1 [Amia ocellicauda]|uniref:zinc finger protein-like 1 n=1 Tax=Amia ocellicauda TaxID=2972642 RepID=UPI003463F6E6
MGLCKCPKRKVTNLFCFEHRVNVCEHCLVSNHAKCIVQSYLQWLQDSDYNPNCRLCSTPLASQDTVRLVCYDVFHWSCLNELAARLPPNTAPAGYQCPSCQGPVFPPTNLASPVADVLRDTLSSVNWARAGLGLPLIEETARQEVGSNDTTDYTNWSSFDTSGVQASDVHSVQQASGLSYSSNPSPSPQADYGAALNNGGVGEVHSVINMTSEVASDSITIHTASSPRKLYDTRDASRSSVMQVDFDDDKYRRRPALGWFAQLLRSRSGTKRTALTLRQRVLLLLLLGVLGFLTLIVVMSKLGRASADSDPNLDPLLNPHIRVGNN